MKTRKLTAILLALCMLLSLSISAFAADDAIASGTIQDSKITWKLDNKGWLTISGSGDCSAFASKDDQPWAEYRSQITQVWFDGMESLAIPNLAYWFEDCTNLTTAEIPSTTPVIGRHAFYNCPLLTKLSIYYGEHTLDNIGEDAFWRETDNGDTLYVAYIIGYPDSSVPFHDYDWNSSNRSDRYFYDVYGAYKNADSTAPVVSDSAIKKAPAATATYASTGIVGTCPSCNQYSLQGTYVEQTHTSRGHQEYYECYKCHYVKNLGTYVYKEHGDGSYGSWTCPSCGSHTWVLDYQSDATCTSNGYRSYSCACGQTKSETIYASGHSYSYGSWEEYSSSQHRREAYCRNCGATDYDYRLFPARCSLLRTATDNRLPRHENQPQARRRSFPHRRSMRGYREPFRKTNHRLRRIQRFRHTPYIALYCSNQSLLFQHLKQLLDLILQKLFPRMRLVQQDRRMLFAGKHDARTARLSFVGARVRQIPQQCFGFIKCKITRLGF